MALPLGGAAAQRAEGPIVSGDSLETADRSISASKDDVQQPRSPADVVDDRVNILLVDDQPANLVALEAMLQGLGQNLIRAESGREALKWLLTHEFAVILLDVKMPGMDGFETAAMIRER